MEVYYSTSRHPCKHQHSKSTRSHASKAATLPATSKWWSHSQQTRMASIWIRITAMFPTHHFHARVKIYCWKKCRFADSEPSNTHLCRRTKPDSITITPSGPFCPVTSKSLLARSPGSFLDWGDDGLLFAYKPPPRHHLEITRMWRS